MNSFENNSGVAESTVNFGDIRQMSEYLIKREVV